MAGEDCVNCRTILWYLIFFGTAMNCMVRTCINIAIVSMVANPGTNLMDEPQVNECFERNKTHGLNNYTNTAFIPTTELPQDKEFRFAWNEHQQNLILGAFFWLYWATQLPGGMLANRYGGKLVFGLSNLLMFILGLVIPISTTIGYELLIAIRVLQGIVGGSVWPSMHALIAQWVPPNERSKFVTASTGSSVGTALTFPICGVLIHSFGWPSVFYVSSGLGLIWAIAWWLLIYDSPAKHPRISEAERNYIQGSLGESVTLNTVHGPTPWRHIFKSTPMWLVTFAQWGNLWGLFTITTQAPTYFNYIHGLDIQMTGVLSGMPHLAAVILGFILSVFCDYLLRTDRMSRTAVRKLAIAVCCIGQAGFMLGLAFSGCNYVAAIVFMTAAIATSGAESAGQLASLIDLSPNYASILLGICSGITVVPGFISSFIVGALTYQNQTVGQWQIVYLITALMLIIPGILHLIFGSSQLQSWNSDKINSKIKLQNTEEGVEEKNKDPVY